MVAASCWIHLVGAMLLDNSMAGSEEVHGHVSWSVWQGAGNGLQELKMAFNQYQQDAHSVMDMQKMGSVIGSFDHKFLLSCAF